MSWRTTEALGTVREVQGEPRTIEGTAVPYGVVAEATELGREAFAPRAFSASVAHWMSRTDGARMAFRPAHRQDPVGVVTNLEDTPDGVKFRAVIDEDPDGDKYLKRVRSGLNGVSIEVGLPPNSKRMRDGTVLHREAKLHAIAGSISPAYDGARIALRDMEDEMAEQETPVPNPPEPPAPEPPPAPVQRTAETRAVEPISLGERSRIERTDALVQEIQRAPIVINRDASMYGREAARLPSGSPAGFLSDGLKAWTGDRAAEERQYRYEMAVRDLAAHMEREAVLAYRAGDVLSSEIPGAYPNDYVPSLLTPRILKGRPMGGFFNRFPVSDALPKIFPKVTTSTTVAVQSAEGANPAASDFATTAVSVTPLLYGAETVVSRQVLDGSNPSAEAMIMNDMLEAYAQASEVVIKTAVEAGATASGQAIVAATPFAGLIANIVAYTSARFTQPEGIFVPSALWAVAAKQPDTGSLKPLLAPINPQNSVGSLTGGTLGANLLGTDVIHSYASTTNVVVTARREDYVIYESAISRFSYDQATGPAAVRIGLWAYLAVGVRRGGLSVTAA